MVRFIWLKAALVRVREESSPNQVIKIAVAEVSPAIDE